MVVLASVDLIRSQPYSSMLTLAPLTQSKLSTKCRPSRSANSSIWPTPYCSAKAKTVFFWVSVGSTCELSPARCAAAKSPRSAVETFRSLIWCRSLPRSTRTRRTSALPYWLSPKTMLIGSSSFPR